MHFARHAKKSGGLMLKKIPPESALYRFHPDLRSMTALFAWSHPVTGIASGPKVVYAAESAGDSRLLTLKIKRGARVCALRDHDGKNLPAKPRRFAPRIPRGADLIFHEISYDDGSSVREWVVLNPACVESFTADARFLRRFFKQELSRLADPRYDYPPRAAHAVSKFPGLRQSAFLSVTSPGLRDKIVLPALRAVARLSPRRIPLELRTAFPEFSPAGRR